MTPAADSSLAGQVALVTGGARGIGLATAKALLARGAKVAIGDLDPKNAGALEAELGADALVAPLDVADRDSFAGFVSLAEERLGPIDILVNNAGIMSLGRFHEQTEDVDARILAINVAGVLHGMRLVLPGMIARGSGQIVNVASVAGKAPTPGALTYGASKAAVLSATETARVEYAGTGVGFTAVMPSFTNTELISGTAGTKLVKTIEPADVGEAIAKGIERGRKDIYVPTSVGKILWTYPIVGRRVRDAMARALGADKVFLQVDKLKRAAYDARSGIDSSPAPPSDGPAETEPVEPDSARA